MRNNNVFDESEPEEDTLAEHREPPENQKDIFQTWYQSIKYILLLNNQTLNKELLENKSFSVCLGTMAIL